MGGGAPTHQGPGPQAHAMPSVRSLSQRRLNGPLGSDSTDSPPTLPRGPKRFTFSVCMATMLFFSEETPPLKITPLSKVYTGPRWGPCVPPYPRASARGLPQLVSRRPGRSHTRPHHVQARPAQVGEEVPLRLEHGWAPRGRLCAAGTPSKTISPATPQLVSFPASALLSALPRWGHRQTVAASCYQLPPPTSPGPPPAPTYPSPLAARTLHAMPHSSGAARRAALLAARRRAGGMRGAARRGPTRARWARATRARRRCRWPARRRPR